MFYGIAKDQNELDGSGYPDDLKKLWSLGNNYSYDFGGKFGQFYDVY